MKRLFTLAIAAGFVALAAAPAAAFGPDDDPGWRTMRKMRAMHIAEIQEKLNLDEKTTIRINEILKKFDEKRDALKKEVKGHMQSIKDLMDAPKPDEAKLTPILDKLVSAREKIHDVQTDQLSEIRKLLTPTQQAKFVLHLQQWKKHMKEMIRKHRGWRQGQGPGPGGPGGPGGAGMGPGPHGPGMGLGMGPGMGPGGPDGPPDDDDEF
ncbi:MAG: periplasmic heavy metal sensor [Deltaproteobacteria bacterium]|nr:periplasmic heavy metal sensor [Deltaproteobacteria bacterium]